MTVGLGSFYETCPKGLSSDSSSLLNCRPSLHSPPSPSSPFPLPFPLLTVEPIKRIRIYIKNSFKLLEENEKGNLWVHFNENIYEQMYEMYYWGNFTNRTLLFVFCFVFYFELREQEGHTLIVLNFCFSDHGSCMFSIFNIFTVFQKIGQNNLKKLYTSLSNAFFQPLNGKYSNIYTAFTVVT